MIDVGRERFEQIVVDALDALPPAITAMLRNVAVTVEDGTDPHLLGLYQGIPLTERNSDYSGVLPDHITIFRLAICARCHDDDEVVDEVATTVVHELGHHVGIDDARLHELGW